MKINSMFFIAMCGLCISCGAEITTDTSSEVLSDKQIPIGISTVAVPEYGAETTRGLIANATYRLGLFRTGDKGYPPQYDAPYTYTATGWTASTEGGSSRGEFVCLLSLSIRFLCRQYDNSRPECATLQCG